MDTLGVKVDPFYCLGLVLQKGLRARMFARVPKPWQAVIARNGRAVAQVFASAAGSRKTWQIALRGARVVQVEVETHRRSLPVTQRLICSTLAVCLGFRSRGVGQSHSAENKFRCYSTLVGVRWRAAEKRRRRTSQAHQARRPGS